MKIRAFVLALLFAVGAAPAVAQDVKIQATPPKREQPDAADTRAQRYERARLSDREFYPDGPRVGHDPGFVESLSSEYQDANSSGRVGIAGWTSPASPLGPEVTGRRELAGWFGFGFAVTWGGPPQPARPPAAK